MQSLRGHSQAMAWPRRALWDDDAFDFALFASSGFGSLSLQTGHRAQLDLLEEEAQDERRNYHDRRQQEHAIHRARESAQERIAQNRRTVLQEAGVVELRSCTATQPLQCVGDL